MVNPDDWIIDANGFYIASRAFLMRRGYCCANQCRNCPYINWRNTPIWEPLPAAAVLVAVVSPKAIEGAQLALTGHERALQQGSLAAEAHHQAMAAHYRLLLERWEASRGKSSEGAEE